MSVEPHLKTWTAAEYDLMTDAGVFADQPRVELIEGEIVEMAPMGDRHIRCITVLNALLTPQAAGHAVIQVQIPARVSDLSEPEPDLSVLRWYGEFRGKATPADVLLFIEVSDSTVAYDRRVKVPLYARAAIPETWIVDLPAGAIEVHRQPAGGAYSEVRRHLPGEAVPVPGLGGFTIDVGFVVGG